MALRDFPLNFVGGDTQQINIDGDFFAISEAAGAVYVSLDSGPFVKRVTGQSQKTYFNQIRIKSDIAQTVRFVAGYGELTDGRNQVTATVIELEPASLLANDGDTVIPAASSALVCAGNAKRHRALINSAFENAPDIVARVGGATVGTASGIQLQAGQGITLDTTAAIYVYNPGAENITICVLEEERP